MNRVLVLTDAVNLQSGLARCGRELLGRLHSHPSYQCAQAGWHSQGLPHQFPIQIFPIHRFAQDEPERLFQIIQQFRPHYFLGIGDPFYFQWLRNLRDKVKMQMGYRMNWMGWITIDGDPIHPGQLEHLMPFDRVMFMSKWSQEVVNEALIKAEAGDYKQKVLGKEGKVEEIPFYREEVARLRNSTVLYPGVDPQIFHVLSSPPYYGNPSYSGRDGKKFVVLVVDQNTSRKAVAVAIDAYRKFAKGKDNVALHMVTNSKDPNGADLQEILNREPCNSIVIHENSPITALQEHELNQVYNLATVLFSATSGEGYKLPILEAMATGCLNVMPDYTSPTEIIGENEERGLLIDVPEDSYWYGSFGYRKMVVPRDKCVEGLERAYKLWQEGKMLDKLTRAQNYAAELTWDTTFTNLLQNLRAVYEEQQMEFVSV